MLATFLVRAFYFTGFELLWQGRTPGKRLVGVRVIDRNGGALGADAVIARNLMREVELFLPLSLWASLQLELLLGGSGESALALIWTGVFLLMPFFNRDRLRVGDIIGGTWVVREPKVEMLPDLSRAHLERKPATHLGVSADGATPSRPAIAFTQEQLSVYGIYELQVLEDVLRTTGAHADKTRAEVADRIQRKIAWTQPGGPVRVGNRAFLEVFYTALRAHLEKGMLFGKRRESKHDGASSTS